jgi:hypothetical protein
LGISQHVAATACPPRRHHERALCEREEAKAINDDPAFNIEFLSVAVDRLGRIADRLGLHRVQKNIDAWEQFSSFVEERVTKPEPSSSDEDEASRRTSREEPSNGES